LVTARDNTTELYATDISGRVPPYTADTTQKIDIDADNPTQLRVMLPGMSADMGDSADGKSGAPQDQIAGTTFIATLQAADNFWNVADSTDLVHIEITDPYAVPVATRRYLLILPTRRLLIPLPRTFLRARGCLLYSLRQ
jgi:hypothetical protein